MKIQADREFLNDPVISGKALRLIFGRVAFVFLLLMAKLWQTGGAADLAAGGKSDGILILFSLSVPLAVVYYGMLRLLPGLIWQIRLQIALDVVCITWLVLQAGDVISPYVTLYIVLISVAGFFLGKTETLVLAMTCAVSFTTLSILAANDLVSSAAGDQPGSRTLQIVGVNDVAILLVGLIAARLSERRRLTEELKHSEASFADLHLLHERIVESIGSGLITTDLAGRIYAFNRAAGEITGLRPEEAIGKSVYELFGSEMKDAAARCLDTTKTGESSAVHFETTFADKNGTSGVQAVSTLVPLISQTGSVSGLIVTVQDVTQMKALEETVRRSDRLAAVGRMAAGLAHEIRNPLGSMSSALQFLQERNSGEGEQKALMDVVLRESDRMNNIITNFLAFARPSSSAALPNRSLVAVKDALDDCMSLIRHSPEASDDHEFEVRAADDILIAGDETQLKQVCWNLARNALQSMPNGGILTVTAQPENDKVRLEFRDTGIGMDQKMIEHMFEPFVSGTGGTGLGLSIVHKIVQDHGGRIDVVSYPGKGTNVTVEFPATSNKD